MLTRNHFLKSSLLYYVIVLLTSIIGTFFDIVFPVYKRGLKLTTWKNHFVLQQTKEVLRVLDQGTFIAANFKHPSGYTVGDNPKEQSVVYKTAGCRSSLQKSKTLNCFPKWFGKILRIENVPALIEFIFRTIFVTRSGRGNLKQVHVIWPIRLIPQMSQETFKIEFRHARVTEFGKKALFFSKRKLESYLMEIFFSASSRTCKKATLSFRLGSSK